MDSKDNKSEEKKIYCRLLGHEVPFSYCVKPGSELFCRNITGCWAGKMDIETWIRERYTAEQIEQAMKPVSAKMDSLLELIRKAKERGGKDTGA